MRDQKIVRLVFPDGNMAQVAREFVAEVMLGSDPTDFGLLEFDWEEAMTDDSLVEQFIQGCGLGGHLCESFRFEGRPRAQARDYVVSRYGEHEVGELACDYGLMLELGKVLVLFNRHEGIAA